MFWDRVAWAYDIFADGSGEDEPSLRRHWQGGGGFQAGVYPGELPAVFGARRLSGRAVYPLRGADSLRDSSVSAHVILTRALQTRPASLGSRLKGQRPAARIISALSAQKFHSAAWVRLDQLCCAKLAQLESHPTCRARRVFPDVCAAWVRLDQTRCAKLARLESHPLAAGENDFESICAVHGTNSARLF